MKSIIETLLEKPCWVIDFLPEQVPENSKGQFFAVERFFLQNGQQSVLRRQFAEFLLKLNCYCDLWVCTPEGEQWEKNPAPECLYSRITADREDLCILLPGENALLTLNREDLYMTVYHPSGRLRRQLERLSAGSGLFFRKPLQNDMSDG